MGIALAWPDARRIEFGREAGEELGKHRQAATLLAGVRGSSSSAYVSAPSVCGSMIAQANKATVLQGTMDLIAQV